MNQSLLFVPRFNRLRVLLPMLAAIALVATTFLVNEDRRSYVTMLGEQITASQQRLAELGELIHACADAESSQRGYLLTEQERYLEPFSSAKSEAYRLVATLESAYSVAGQEERTEMVEIRRYVDNKFSEMEITIDLLRGAKSNRNAVSVFKTDVGLTWMAGLRSRIAALQAIERENIRKDIGFWNRQIQVTRIISAIGAALNVILLLYAGALVTRDISRRERMNAVLDERVTERTAELEELSQHMLKSTERSKSRLARELHDELGGLLVAIKMDLAQLARRVDLTSPDIQVRWKRIQNALASGIELKRRVIEELRPTLLDNMGLCAALRWQAEQSCEAAGIKLNLALPDEEVPLRPEAGIAVFRVVQESLTNVAKHSRATEVWLSVSQLDDILTITIEDNGIGLQDGEGPKIGSHGLLGMKHRMLAIGGTLDITGSYPHGVRVVVTCPLQGAAAA